MIVRVAARRMTKEFIRQLAVEFLPAHGTGIRIAPCFLAVLLNFDGPGLRRIDLRRDRIQSAFGLGQLQNQETKPLINFVPLVLALLFD